LSISDKREEVVQMQTSELFVAKKIKDFFKIMVCPHSTRTRVE